MDTSLLMQTFAKGSKAVKAKGGNCIIYTRVSSKDQEDNSSLVTQKKSCEEYAKKAGLNICGYFGGTSESAKTDERIEFNKMLSFVKMSQHKIDQIIVYSVDRFSRSGPNAIYIAEQLKKTGIALYAVTQPTDALTASGGFQQNIQFLFSEYDNQLRREKTIAGMREMLLRGEWCGVPPIGYDILHRDGKRMLVVNEKGKMLRKAFYRKAREKVTNEEIRKQLIAAGFKHLTPGKMSWILRNPFYCGILSHTALNGQLVKGNHEKICSEELFLEVNGLILGHIQGYKQNLKDHLYPLKRFIKCDNCGSWLRASAKSDNKYSYYQCNTKQCLCSRRVEPVHDQFRQMLEYYTLRVDDDMRYLIRNQMIATYHQATQENEQLRTTLSEAIKEGDRKLNRLEERYILEEINRDMYEKYELKFKNERQEIERQLGRLGDKVSKIEECIDTALEFSSKLATAWDHSDLKTKQQIQFLVFPDGISYNRKNDLCRTNRVNEFFSCVARQQRVLTIGGFDDGTNIDQDTDWVAPIVVERP